MAVSRKRYVVDVIILFAVSILGVAGVRNAHAVGDWAFFLRYDPPAEITALAHDAGMSETGKRKFMRFSPELLTADELQQACGDFGIGCIKNQNIYILKDTTPEQRNRSVVTAGHEMLHVAWSRLTQEEKQELISHLSEQITTLEGDPVLNRFSRFQGNEYYNEAHSYLGTEVDRLSPALEEHYRQFFDDRQKIVRAFKNSPDSSR